MRGDSARIIALLGVLISAMTIVPVTASAHEATLRGLVLGTIPARAEVIVRHGPILTTPAGVATFRLASRGDAARLRPGDTIVGTADLDVAPWTLGSVRIDGSEPLTGDRAPVAAPHVLRSVHHVTIGEYAPAGDFVDQRNHHFSLRDLRGRSIVMAFFYARCRDKRECPLITARFRALQERFRGQPVHLVEVTLDPAHDRPALLAGYGKAFGADPSRWSFATGDPERVLDFAAQFDVTAFPDERVGLIHPERLVILDGFGAIRELVDEGAWTADEVVAAVAHDERLASNPIERLDLWLSSAAVAVCGNAVAGFSGFTDLLTVVGIALFFGFLIWRVGRGIARAA